MNTPSASTTTGSEGSGTTRPALLRILCIGCCLAETLAPHIEPGKAER